MGYSPDNKDIEYYTGNENKIESIYLNKAQVLLEALPYIKEYSGKIVVVKIGGSMMEDDSIMQSVLDDIVLMKYVGIKVVLVHGGGKQITELMKTKNIKVEFVDGLRVTDKEAIEVVKMVLIGDINTKVVSFLNKHGRAAIGVSGNDANFIICRKKYYKKNGKNIDLGFVGEITNVDTEFITSILESDYIPVVATLATDMQGNIYNINADSCASEIAVALKAIKMILLTDVDGIIEKEGYEFTGDAAAAKAGKSKKEAGRLISRLSSGKCMELIKIGSISSGMVPKVMACIDSLKGGVNRTYIINGTTEHSILVEIFTDKGIGTMITL
ncbi:MAG: acetylglutamate kinase [Actinobacteria bacterium]|nr:acetylglutamate kinase [Actinomycetota bacterium]